MNKKYITKTTDTGSEDTDELDYLTPPGLFKPQSESERIQELIATNNMLNATGMYDTSKRKISDKLKDLRKALALPKEALPKKIDIIRFPEEATLGAVRPSDNSMYINKRLIGENNPQILPVLAHELQHYNQPKHSKSPMDLMYPEVTLMDLNKDFLTNKVRNKAIQNLERQEMELIPPANYDVDVEGRRYKDPEEIRPIPVRQMYENIEKNVPKEKKNWWWTEEDYSPAFMKGNK